MEIDITLDLLPEHILEKIFLNVSKRENLRLVCKTFKNIIDKSAKLLKNKWLLVYETLGFDSSTIHHPFQNLTIVRISTDEMNWIYSYQHKDRIKAIKFRCREEEAVRSAKSIQYILTNFNSLEMIHFEMEDFYDRIYSFGNKIRLIPNNSSKLKTLEVDYYCDHRNNILKMFSNVSTIKNLIIKNFEVLKFPKKNKWNLEKLIILNEDNEDGIIDDERCLDFLKSQHSSLKELKIPNEYGYAYFVMCNLPNLKNLTCGIVDDEIDDSILLTNTELQRLNIQDYSDGYDDILKIVLNHYNKIKYLGIISDYSSSRHDLQPLTIDSILENLTHLMLKGAISFPFLSTNRLNIKVLGLKCNKNDEDFDCSQFLNENMKNVNKLSLYFLKVKDVLVVIQKCPNLTELNLNIEEWNKEQNDSFISNINDILAVTTHLNCLGVSRNILKQQKMTIETLLDQIVNKQVRLKSCASFKSMITKDWGMKHVQYLRL